MTSKQRMIKALEGGKPDRLPVTTHHILDCFRNEYLGGKSSDEFFAEFGLDPIVWTVPHTFREGNGDYFDPSQKSLGFLESKRVMSDSWRIEQEDLSDNKLQRIRYSFVTPKKTLNMTVETDKYSSWVTEHLIKEKSDIDIIGEYMTQPVCDVEEVNKKAEKYGDSSLIRGHICTFDVFGQPGCWQDAACLVGIENLIMATFDDDVWVHELLKILQKRKIEFVRSLKGAKYDVLELGGGDASTTVISPDMFRKFVAVYDSVVIEEAHKAGQRISYHTCGGMMPILEDIAGMGPDAMETFTPEGMSGDANLREAKNRIGGKVCMIGGFDQFHFFQGCTPEKTRAEVRRCFEEAGEGGGYILCPSDHFFDADLELIHAFADEARKCVY